MKRILKKIYAKSALWIKKNTDEKYWKIGDEKNCPGIHLVYEEVDNDILQKYNSHHARLKKEDGPYYKYLVHAHSKYLYQIENCVIEPSNNWVIINRNSLFRYSFPYFDNPWFGASKPAVLKTIIRKTSQVVETAAHVHYRWNNYYHFFVDVLTMMEALDLANIPDSVPVIVPNNYTTVSYVKQYETIMGPFKRKIIIMDKVSKIRVRKLFIAKEPLFSPITLIAPHKLIEKVVGKNTPTFPERIFVTRYPKFKRTLRNNSEIAAFLEGRGYTVIEASDYTLAEQVQLFNKARYIVSIHGASLTNLLFCKPGQVKLVELFADNFQVSCYEQLSIMMDIAYTRLVGSPLGNDSYFEIDLEELKKVVDRLHS